MFRPERPGAYLQQIPPSGKGLSSRAGPSMGLAFNRVLDRPLSSVPRVDGVAVVDQSTVTPYKSAMTNVKCS